MSGLESSQSVVQLGVERQASTAAVAGSMIQQRARNIPTSRHRNGLCGPLQWCSRGLVALLQSCCLPGTRGCWQASFYLNQIFTPRCREKAMLHTIVQEYRRIQPSAIRIDPVVFHEVSSLPCTKIFCSRMYAYYISMLPSYKSRCYCLRCCCTRAHEVRVFVLLIAVQNWLVAH